MTTKPTIAGKLFEREEVNLAAAIYVDCVFNHCQLVYDGAVLHMSGCDYHECDWRLTDGASNVVDMLRSMWEMGCDKSVSKIFGHITGIDPRQIHKALTGE